MKPRVLLIVMCVALIGGALAWRLARRPAASEENRATVVATSPAPAVPAAATKPGLNTSVEAAAVFQRAFWRKPDATVRILNAERREWADEKTTVQKWQWFIALETQPGFRRWLLEENPFGLVKATESLVSTDLAGAPAWFPAMAKLQTCASYRVPGAAFRVFVESSSGQLFATDAGAGFATAAR